VHVSNIANSYLALRGLTTKNKIRYTQLRTFIVLFVIYYENVFVSICDSNNVSVTCDKDYSRFSNVDSTTLQPMTKFRIRPLDVGWLMLI
jgi:hypothetical protein